ncbi:hypothetical protein [Isoptericola dokdonensis]|jgi:hypothetical protein|uniref:Glycosyl transferase family 2 n=1 Tax=Isoptericola dokdonensis DS-3 TaxID=1300344 RepID=A0A161I3L2_9MICO|nr:hypothetical protein [Isoptericola dokdonensis]ANC32725.1 hypothetical protein I598_3215 [Isoptericola dokdonensis DS-3]
MRRHAYVLAADPHFLTASIRSYYDRVDRIVVSYDATSTSWTGTPLPVEQCLAAIRALDVDGRCVLAPGSFADLDRDPLTNDTRQRQVALDQASEGADWVVQLDTDEVLARPETFFAALDHTEEAAADGLDYPARWLYTRAGADRFLESSTRFGRPVASFPGPLAVRAGTTLTLSRQADVPLYRVDLRPWNTDPHHPRTAVVHEVVPLEAAVLHYSWVRPPEIMRRKFAWSGHAAEYTRRGVYERWESFSRRPRLAALTSPLRSDDWFRVGRVPDAATDVP